MQFDMTMAVALIGSVGTICLTIMKIVDMKKSGKEDAEYVVEISELKRYIAVQETQINELKNDIERLQNSFDKQNDLLIKFLSSN